MIKRTIAVSILALGLYAPMAMSFDGYDCSRFDSHTSYCFVKGAPNVSSKPFGASVVNPTKHVRIGDFIDESIEERNARSSHR